MAARKTSKKKPTSNRAKKPASTKKSAKSTTKKPAAKKAVPRTKAAAGPAPRTKDEAHLRDYAMRFPEVTEDLPWGHRAFKIKGKVFCFLHTDDEGMSISVKLPMSNAAALSMNFAEPTGYGLGKSGWVSAYFWKKERPPMPMLEAWIEESFCAVAPKKIVAALAAR